MKLNKAGLAFKELRFSPSTKDADINNAAIEIWKIENLAVDMYEMLKLAISLMDGDSIEDFAYQYQEIKSLLKRARGE